MIIDENTFESKLERLLAANADERVSVLLRWGNPDDQLLTLIDSISKLSVVNAKRAVEATQMAIDLSDRLDCSLAQARSRRAATRALAYAGRFEDSMAIGTEAVKLAAEAGLVEEVGRLHLAIMHPYIETGRFAEAITAGLHAHELFDEAGNTALAARADINLGIIYQRSDNLNQAMECFDRARPHFDDDPLTRGHLDNSRGEALVALNEFEAAEQAFIEARDAFDASDAALTAAIAESNLADLAVRRGRLAEAMSYFERARRRLEASQSITHLARLHAEQADAHLLLGLPQDALTGYETALVQLLDCGLTLEAARARAGMGAALFRTGRLVEAETALAAAAVGYDELGHTTARARIDLVRSEIALSRHQYDTARVIAMKSLAVLHHRPADAAQVRLVLARVAMLTGENEIAETEINAGLIAARKLDLAPLLADLYHAQGCLQLDAESCREAVVSLTTAANHVERVHGSLQARRFRMAFLGDRALIYEDLVRAYLGEGGPDSIQHALQTAERCKGRELLDEIRDAFAEPSPDDKTDSDDNRIQLHRKILEARSDLDALYSHIADEQYRENSIAADRLGWKETLHKQEARLEALEARLDIVTGRTTTRKEDVEVTSLPEDMLEESVIIEYFIARGELMAFIIDSRCTPHWQSLGEIGDIGAMMKRLRFQIDRGLHADNTNPQRQDRLHRDYRREAKNLHDRLLKPFAKQLEGVRRVTLIPHGPLHAIPMHVLHDGERYLIESCAVHYAPSLGMLRQLWVSTKTVDQERGEMLAVGVSDKRAPNIQKEARAVASRFTSSRLLLGNQASLATVTEAMCSSRRLHFACHGSFTGDNPLGSGLRLADGWLTARRIYGLRLCADLVVLSACETGCLSVKSGDELMGLARAVLSAGARSLLLTLWKVDDSTAAELMTRFYEYLGDAASSVGKTADSIRAAQLDMLNNNEHPAKWGPFALIGTP